ncbi:hypothetical protein C8J57DRAFT_60091 [Mycena rebaudengoi]|nr:hypothetical protein C8J57DRAFT_60091 [Mycena rebaudengoi]
MDGDSERLVQPVLESIRTHCPRFDSVSLFLLGEASDEDIEAIFALEGLKHLTINSFQAYVWMDDLHPSIIEAIRASPALETLHIAFNMSNEAKWDVHQTFAELSGVHFPRLRALSIRQHAKLDCRKLRHATDPFLQFLDAHHAQLETLELPCPDANFAYGPAELRFPAHFFPSLTAFEGPGFLCRRLSELPHPAARLKRLTVLLDRAVWDGDHDIEQAQLLDTLRACSALEALSIRPMGDMAHTPEQLCVLAQAAPSLTELVTGVNLQDGGLAELAPALAAFTHLQTLGVPVASLLEGTPTELEEFVTSLAAAVPAPAHRDRHRAADGPGRALGGTRQPSRWDY